METDSLYNGRGKFQELRNMWSSKTQIEEKPFRPTSIPSRPHPPKQREEQKKSPKDSISTFKTTNEISTITPIKKESSITPDNEKTHIFESIKELPSIEEDISLPILPPPPSIVFQHQAKSIGTLKRAVNKMAPNQEKKIPFKDSKTNGIHLWHIARHVFRSGLIFNRARRASDSLLPLLMRTHEANHQSRKYSMDSTFSQTPFESLINYVTYNKENDKDSLIVPMKIKRSASETNDCLRRNKLEDSIFQYEMILRHLKNYEQFMSTYPSISLKQRQKSIDSEPSITLSEIEEKFLAKTSIPNRQTQSLSRNVGRTFSEFILNDLFLSPSSKRSSNEQRYLSISHVSSQTDLSELIHDNKDQTNNPSIIVHSVEIDRNHSVSNEEATVVLNELDTMLDNNDQELPITPNSEVNVIVLNSPVPSREEDTLPIEKPLMQRLFEGKKTAYSSADLHMVSLRLPEEMMPTYETAVKKCFFDTEEVVYAAKMIKISRRGYTQHVRLLCLTTERVYNLTKRDPYPKEGLLFNDIWAITCTPYKDGFICIHTKDAHEDRGDWLIVVDHPCEFITTLFMLMGRDNNDDHFLRFESKFTHCRRCLGEASSNDCSIEARLSDTFRIKKADFDFIIIFTP